MELAKDTIEIPQAGSPAFEEQRQKEEKINKYLTSTMKHLNVTIDILID